MQSITDAMKLLDLKAGFTYKDLKKQYRVYRKISNPKNTYHTHLSQSHAIVLNKQVSIATRILNEYLKSHSINQDKSFYTKDEYTTTILKDIYEQELSEKELMTLNDEYLKTPKFLPYLPIYNKYLAKLKSGGKEVISFLPNIKDVKIAEAVWIEYTLFYNQLKTDFYEELWQSLVKRELVAPIQNLTFFKNSFLLDDNNLTTMYLSFLNKVKEIKQIKQIAKPYYEEQIKCLSEYINSILNMHDDKVANELKTLYSKEQLEKRYPNYMSNYMFNIVAHNIKEELNHFLYQTPLSTKIITKPDFLAYKELTSLMQEKEQQLSKII